MREIRAASTMSDEGRPAYPTCTPEFVSRRLHAIAERQVVPRLMRVLARDIAPPVTTRKSATSSFFGHEDAAASLAAGLAKGDRAASVDVLERLIRGDTGNGFALLEVLSAAANHLDQLHARDAIDVAHASLASCTLQYVLQHFKAYLRPTIVPDEGPRALLVSPDQRVDALTFFGLRLCSEFFRRDGWDVQIEHDMTSELFRSVVKTEWFDVIEVFATRSTDLDATAIGIRMVRSICPNSALGVVVCGDLFRQQPDLVRDVGADRLAADPSTSVSHARSLRANATRRLE